MGLFVPNNPSFGYFTGNVTATRPADNLGTAITPGASNTYGSYVQILAAASVARDCYGILLNFNSGFANANARDTIVTIGVDSAGGTSYVDTISHLLATCASQLQWGGHSYYFPLFIKAGSSLAAKASVNNATAGSISCIVHLYGAPKNISGLVYGHGVETVGAVTASSAGTSVTSGEASEGTWTSIGTTTKRWKFVQHGFGVNDNSLIASNVYHADLSFGDGTNQVILDQDKSITVPAGSEQLHSDLRYSYCDVLPGQTIYGRIQCSGTSDPNLSMIAYGVY